MTKVPQTRILICRRPFVSTRLAQKSGNNRPAAAIIVAIMENLEKDGFGALIKIGLSQVFFIRNCSDLTDEELKTYGITREKYLQAFAERAGRAVISKEAFNGFLEKSPKKRELRNLHSIVPEED